MQTLHVDVGHIRYPITIGAGLLGDPGVLQAELGASHVLVVSNTTVAPLYLDRLRAGLGDRRVVDCILPDGERYKTLQAVSQVLDALVTAKLNRDAAVLALGGGVVGDIAGFAASCYQRGVAYVQVPTTLLAQVDSAVGGKTGVNHPGGKNLIGAFYQPQAVVADTDTLATLPDRELRAGLAEVIKYGCVCDGSLFQWLETHIGDLAARDPEALAYAIGRSCAIKASVVARDEREHDIRALLNFGHTFGHAIEAATNFGEYLHGEAVGLGMLMAADLSCSLGWINRETVQRVQDLLGRTGLPNAVPRIGAPRAFDLMQMDKKVLAGTVRLILMKRLGEGVVTGDYDRHLLDATLEKYFA